MQVRTTLAESIFLGLDVHKASVSVARALDNSTAQPTQKFSWPDLMAFVAKQQKLARKVYLVYEAGPFGFEPARQFLQSGIQCWVVHPQKLDPRHKRVQTDRLDAGHLLDNLQAYVRGNLRAMVPVRIPTREEEQRRLESRHRGHLLKELKRLKARGWGLLLSQGIRRQYQWWQAEDWMALTTREPVPVSPELKQILADEAQLIRHYQALLKEAEAKLRATAPKILPRGFGRKTFELLKREVADFHRFQSRRKVAGFTGLCGAVSSSGPYHLDLSINKAGNPCLRAWLVELAWRMLFYQPDYTGLRVWRKKCGGVRGGSTRQRKIAIVAVARQLAVDIWRWQTGRVTPEQLGWVMGQAA